jgi:hypothetical protein
MEEVSGRVEFESVEFEEGGEQERESKGGSIGMIQ